MKNKIRILTVLMAVMLCMAAFSITAYAGGGPESEETTAEQAEETTEETAEPQALTPEGNLTLVDDIDGEQAEDKQFITVVTKSGNYFYIIIDRAEDGENTVHFLNLVDEADLMALIEGETASVVATPSTCICTDKCVAGAVNTNCSVCKTDMTSCMGTAAAAEPEPEPEADESNGSMGGILAVVLILVLAGGGAFYYFKVIKPKQSTKGSSDLDDFDFEDDEDEETSPEILEDEQEDTDE